MAFRLGDYVVYGELRNTHHYSTYGVIVLRGEEPGQETALRLDLTGDCDRDLQGKCFRFTPGEEGTGDAVFRAEDHPGLQVQQIGPTGAMTAQGWVRMLPCSAVEFMRRAELGEPPPTPWKRHLYLEWYSQNGRVVVEMAGALVEECVREPNDKDDEGEWEPLPNLAPPPEMKDAESAAGPEFTLIRQDGDDVHIETWMPCKPTWVEGDDVSPTSMFQRKLDAEAAAIDRALRGECESSDDADSDPDDIRELELMDYCIDHSQRQPIFLLLDGTDQLQSAEELDDEEIEMELKTLLARLAILGIALDVCEHFTPRDCYRLLRDKILSEPHAYAELVGTGWVQHVMTCEYCADCEAADGLTESDSNGRRPGE